MNNKKLDRLIRAIGAPVEGQLGMWQFGFAGRGLFCMTDEHHDRMRVMSPVATLEELSPEQIVECMNANFDRALDARYCLNDDTLWSAFIHPLGCLTEELFNDACYQVAGAADNFGTTYTSGGLTFNPH